MTDPGQQPQPDRGLQPERTALAWRRLALVILGLSLASTSLLWPRLGAWALLPTLAIAAAAGYVLIESHRHYVSRVRDVTSSAPDGRLPLFAAVAATVAGLVWLAVIATAG